MSFGIFPAQGDHPEDTHLLDVALPGFYPAVYPWFKDCLSRTSHPPQQAGTLDAHFFFLLCKCRACSITLATGVGISWKSRGFCVAPMHRMRSAGRAPTPLPHHDRAVFYFNALNSRNKVARMLRGLTSTRSVRKFLRLACGGPILPRWRNW